jgi:hypothetical protein
MPSTWLNHYLVEAGTWTNGQPAALERHGPTVTLPPSGVTVRLHASSSSGAVTLSPRGAPLDSYGQAEVFLTVVLADGTQRYLSAPLTSPVDVPGVVSLRLSLLMVVGNSGCQEIRWQAALNANAVYEVL